MSNTDQGDTPTGPDTGFQLRPLIREVLESSAATDTNALALEVLERIKSYDRETALYQALRQLVRETYRPSFIPRPAEQGPQGPVPTSPARPAEHRDGRQWMPSFVPFHEDDEPVEDVLAAFEAGEKQFTEAPPEDDPQRAAREAQGRALAQQRAAERMRVVPTPPVVPRPSPKVTAIREAWRRTLKQRIATETGGKFFGDCTAPDLEYAAVQREQHAKAVAARAADLRTLAEVMREHGAAKLSDVPAEVLASMTDTLRQAAA